MVVTRAVRTIDEAPSSAAASTSNFTLTTIVSTADTKIDDISNRQCSTPDPVVKSTEPSAEGPPSILSPPVPPPVRYNKPPIYTSDKRAKFTQRENKKWVRLATAVGYLISVCLPAIALSIYYVGFWDPKYDQKVLVINDTTQPPLTHPQTNNPSHRRAGSLPSQNKVPSSKKGRYSVHKREADILASTAQRVIVNIDNNVKIGEKIDDPKLMTSAQDNDQQAGHCWCKVDQNPTNLNNLKEMDEESSGEEVITTTRESSNFPTYGVKMHQ